VRVLFQRKCKIVQALEELDVDFVIGIYELYVRRVSRGKKNRMRKKEKG
jgi:hypothetical protein